MVDKFAWPLRQLINDLIDRASGNTLNELGTASRALATYALDAKDSDQLMPLAIGFIGKTFATDPAASRVIVERLLSPSRMALHAPLDMHWLAHEVGRVSESDPQLVGEIYEKVFAHRETDDAPTSLGNSRILQLTSNRRQDFKMAQWSLKEAFAEFAAKHSREAVQIAIKVAYAYIQAEHALSEPLREYPVSVGSKTGVLTDDYSHVWASEHKGEYSDDAQKIVDTMVDRLKDASDTDALASIDLIISDNRHAWLWARIFMVATERGGVVAAYMWPWAAQLPFLKSVDTLKDAVDLIAAAYSGRTEQERIAFEDFVLELTFPDAYDPKRAKKHIVQRLFGTIGKAALVTQNAKAALDEDEPLLNERLSQTVVSSHDGFDVDHYYWLRQDGVDVEASQNATMLELLKKFEALLKKDDSRSEKLEGIQVLANSLETAGADVDSKVGVYGWERLASGIAEVTGKREGVVDLNAEQLTVIKDALSSILAISTDVERAVTMSTARATAAVAVLNIARANADLAAWCRPITDLLVVDNSPDVRVEIVSRLGYMWDTAKDAIAEYAEKCAATERSPRVMLGLLNAMARLSYLEPDLVAKVTDIVANRHDVDVGEERSSYLQMLGSLVFHSWVAHKNDGSRKIIGHWLNDRVMYEVELNRGSFSIREFLVLGYDGSDPIRDERRARAQRLAYEIIDLTAGGLESYIALETDDQKAGMQESASEDAKLMDHMADQFYFAIGATEIRQDMPPKAVRELEQQRRFLNDNEATFRRIGDVGTPHTIYHNLQLLEFLMPVDAARIFDLAAHAVLSAGRLHGYQIEPLGSQQFVRMIGRLLVDHREIFDDQKRRVRLVEILEVFVSAGWPAARRLLYRLPDALR
jgi:hypothetical protein